jgi:hypothetical protein
VKDLVEVSGLKYGPKIDRYSGDQDKERNAMG